MDSKVVLITGCSSGIGKALAKEYHRCGLKVVATARKSESIKDLKKIGLITEELDVLNKDQMQAVVDKILQKEGRIDILVNNAGYALIGPLIEITAEEIQHQFQTNVFSVLQLCQMVVPSMRNRNSGLIINIGSISGLLTSPFAGAYCASKSSLHSISDALRQELSPFGIQVINAQTGAIRTNFGKAAKERASSVLRPGSWYSKLEEKVLMRAEYSQLKATPVELFANRLVKASLKKHTSPVIRIGKMKILFPFMKTLLPVKLQDHIFKNKFGLNEPV